MEHPHAALHLALQQALAACLRLDRATQGAAAAPCPLAAQAWDMPVLQQAARRLVQPMLVEREAMPIVPTGQFPTPGNPRDTKHQTM